jgi:hypothetical protein
MTRTQLHIMDETAPNSYANRIQMADVGVVPHVGEIVKIAVPNSKEYDVEVFKIEHFFDITRDVHVVMAYTRPANR